MGGASFQGTASRTAALHQPQHQSSGYRIMVGFRFGLGFWSRLAFASPPTIHLAYFNLFMIQYRHVPEPKKIRGTLSGTHATVEMHHIFPEVPRLSFLDLSQKAVWGGKEMSPDAQSHGLDI